ncbi:hypothetical protein KR009_007473 [Drosophila setifemur]|nr:hypothetical protein KR009_007473 [Drosophila setifemur]
MFSLAVPRIMREFKLFREETLECSIKVELVDDQFSELLGEITGPPGTPYDGGKFALDIKVPDSYPFSPPKVRFITRIWHPNISSVTGAICVDILKDNWAAGMTIRTVLLSLQALLGDAEPNDPQDAVVARQYRDHHELFELTAKHWTNVYANGPHVLPECDKKIQALVKMGIEEGDARATLSLENWDMNNATRSLFC